MIKKLLKPLKAEGTEAPAKKKPEYEEIGEAITLNLEEDSSTSLVFSASKDVAQVGSSPHLDVRTWVNSEKYSGPTKKGVNFDVINTPEVVASIILKYLECPEARFQNIVDAINDNVLDGEGIHISIHKDKLVEK